MTGIVLEGGTFRPIFSSGVMDALLSENIILPYCIGVSAGIADGVSYISRQPQRNLEIIQKYRNDKRYMSRSNWAKNKSIFGLYLVGYQTNLCLLIGSLFENMKGLVL